MVSVGRHKNIRLLAYSEVESVSGYIGNFDVKIRRKARFIDEDICTGCGQCAEVCPISVPNPFDIGLSERKVSYRHSAQSVPNAYTIQKTGMAPCRNACPTDQRAMGYIALVRQKRFADAYWAIRRENPFPSVCGRVCNHPCEEACSRGEYDDPVNIMGIKRFVADWAYENREKLPQMQDKSIIGTPFKKNPPPTGKKIAIIGAGPAGLTAGLDLVRLGHKVKVFDALPVAGGMIRVGIPPHRLPYELLDWEIQQIIDEGVEIQLNTWVDDIQGLMADGFDTVLIATGAHQAYKLPIRNSNHPDNWLSLDLIKKACLGEEIDLSGREIIILGAGDVAMDSARVAVRLGKPQVKIVCRGIRASFNEIQEAQEEGVEILGGKTFQRIIVENEKIVGVECLKAEVGGIIDGKRQFEVIPNSEHIISGDLIIWALGQRPDFTFLPWDGSINTRYPVGIQADDEMMTTMEGVFTAGDVRRGTTFFVVDAVAEGHHVARCIDRYLRGSEGVQEPERIPVTHLDQEEINSAISQGIASKQARIPISTIPPDTRVNNFKEVELPLTMEEVLREAERCLQCGVCAECLECMVACDRGAIDHQMQDTFLDVKVGTIIMATGFKDFDPTVAPEYGYGKYPNVITAMEFERMVNSSGPTAGKIVMANGKPPERVAILHCVGSRDENYHEYCSRACCMYSLKLAQLVRDYVDAEVFEIYRDMRTFGKDYEEFYNRTKRKGVNFYHGRISGIEQNNGNLTVKWQENFYNQPDHMDVDMVILATGFEPQPDTGQIASMFGISRSPDGFFLEKHPKLGPVETATDGILLAGACQSPKDIPDSVAQAAGAAAVALSLMDQGTIALDPSVAYVNTSLCAGCGQCSDSCPYNAISIVHQVAEVNPYLCKGCGTCAAACPNKAMTLIHFDDEQLVEEVIGALM
jgi:heterodisulfide reductase subunit A